MWCHRASHAASGIPPGYPPRPKPLDPAGKASSVPPAQGNFAASVNEFRPADSMPEPCPPQAGRTLVARAPPRDGSAVSVKEFRVRPASAKSKRSAPDHSLPRPPRKQPRPLARPASRRA